MASNRLFNYAVVGGLVYLVLNKMKPSASDPQAVADITAAFNNFGTSAQSIAQIKAAGYSDMDIQAALALYKSADVTYG